ncbi:hypothetical protein NEUTE2DRAFT_57173 [Neurospora tetrasperma FGSC 2509]|nr:hypothetical protein NEUTE2DRAFT_57173 [Neurospora tetrasperma FGSC 2509]
MLKSWEGRQRQAFVINRVAFGERVEGQRQKRQNRQAHSTRADWGPNCRNDQTGTMNHGPSRGWNVIDQSGKRDATSAVVCLQGPPAA